MSTADRANRARWAKHQRNVAHAAMAKTRADIAADQARQNAHNIDTCQAVIADPKTPPHLVAIARGILASLTR